MPYAEELPDQCPPADASETGFDVVYRLLKSKTPSRHDFSSKAALGELNKTNQNPCGWASCSLVLNPVAQISRWPRMRDTFAYAAKLSIPQGSGKSKTKVNSNHIDFWRYSDFDIAAAVSAIENLPEVSKNG